MSRQLIYSFTSVAERIRALESKNAAQVPRRSIPSKPKKTAAKLSKSGTFEPKPPDNPEKQALPLLPSGRSTHDRPTYRPESPLHRSVPDEDPIIHAPQPERRMPSIVEPLEQAQHTLDTSRGNDDGFAVSSGFGRRAAKYFAVRRTSRPHEDIASPHTLHHRYRYQLGSVENCARHGRRPPGTLHGIGATRDMVERVRGGEFVPIGMLHRSQLEATSPWMYLNPARLPVEDVCPDCAAEERIMRTEAGLGIRGSDHGPVTPLPPISSITKRNSGMLTATELPNNIGAIVVLQGGKLRRVITNIRQGSSAGPNIRELSEKLFNASQEISRLESSTVSSVSPDDSLQTLILDTQAGKAPPTIHELLQLTDHFANEMQLNIGQKSAPARRREQGQEQSLLHSEDANTLLGSGSPVLTASGPYCVRPTPGPPSAYVTAAPSRKESALDAPDQSNGGNKQPASPAAVLCEANGSVSSTAAPPQKSRIPARVVPGPVSVLLSGPDQRPPTVQSSFRKVSTTQDPASDQDSKPPTSEQAQAQQTDITEAA